MGFGAMLYVYPKYKDLSYFDIQSIKHLLEYETNSWVQKNYSSAEEYAKNNVSNYKPQPKDAIDFYREHMVEDEFGHMNLYKDYADWCSNGGGEIYDFITELGTQVYNDDEGIRILSREDVGKIFNFFLEHIIDGMPKECTIQYAYTYEKDETGSVEDDAKITLIPCDGIEVHYTENNNIRRLDTNPEWESFIGMPDRYYDEWEESGYIEGLRGFGKLLAEVDWENSLIVYSGGW